MHFREIVRMLNLQLTPSQLYAGDYLEKWDYRFCIDFGYSNAVEKAREHWRARRRKKV